MRGSHSGIRPVTTKVPSYNNGSVKPHGHWSIDESKHVKQFFDDFAKNAGFDALVPQNWYNVKTKDIMAQGGASVLHKYAGSLQSALQDIYPTIGLDVSKFPKINSMLKHFYTIHFGHSYLLYHFQMHIGKICSIEGLYLTTLQK
jgi:hypothetical protein